MLTDKENVLQLVALLKAYDIKHIVLSPGSRNSPVSHTFAMEPYFTCHSVVDERSAGFYALGIIQAINQPVAICCTSGSAVLNYAPAVAEAFYQQLPLLVITADRPASQIGQMLGQTLPQSGIFNTLAKKAVSLPEISTPDSKWYCNRLINEAIQALEHNGRGPVQINIPISEPLFQYTTEKLPDIRKINSYRPEKKLENNDYPERFFSYAKRMILAGQSHPAAQFETSLQKLVEEHACVVLCEHLANLHSPSFIHNFDQILQRLTPEEKEQYAPELLITTGGHLVSKRILRFINEYPPKEHWHISETGEIIDTFRQLTDIIECTPESFSQTLLKQKKKTETASSFTLQWQETSNNTLIPESVHPEILATKNLLAFIPENSALHLANSSSVRNALLFPIKNKIKVFSNRGTNGIEGSLSTAVGYAAVNNQLTFLLIGDLSFFYDMNGLWNRQLSNNLRILLINNGRGEIFYKLKGLNQSEALAGYIAAAHQTSAQGWAESLGIHYLQVTNEAQLKEHMELFTSSGFEKPILLEYLIN